MGRRVAVWVGWTPASGGGPRRCTWDDQAGVIDLPTVTAARFRAPTEPVGVADSVTAFMPNGSAGFGFSFGAAFGG